MPNSKVVLLILAAVITVSGCTNGGETRSSGDAIAVERFEVVPQQIYAGSDVTATLNVRNVGNTEAKITTGQQGTNILKSYTPDLLMIEDFSAESTATTKTKEQEAYTLQPDETLSMNWDLHQFDESRIRFYADQQIDMTFQIPFQYTVQAYQQFQVKENSDVQSLESLGAASSNGPMDVHIEMIGSSSEGGSPVFIEGDNIQVRVEFRNNDVEEGDAVGLINIESPEVRALSDKVTVEGCNTPSNIQVSADSSTSITCNVNINGEIQSSIRDEIRVTSDYNFTKTVSKEHITVKYRG